RAGRPSPLVNDGRASLGGHPAPGPGTACNETVTSERLAMFRVVFITALLLFALAMAKLTAGVSGGGGHEAEIDAVRNSPVERIARTGLNNPSTVDAWIQDEFYVGRFYVDWSAEEIAEGINAGKVRVSANMTSGSAQQLERSIVLRF